MNYKYLNKVVDILVSETIIDNIDDLEDDVVITPFFLFPPSLFTFQSSLSFLHPFPPTYFSEFVIEVYGLTEKEIDYVWEQYRNIINDKLDKI